MGQAEASVLRAEFYALPPDAMVDRDTAGAAIYLTRQTMESLAIRGGGPPYVRVGRRALYCKGDLLAWVSRTGRRVDNTSQLFPVA